MMIRKALKALRVAQTVSNEGRNPKLGKGYFEAHRLNPYNPISYIVVAIAVLIGVVLFGILGFWKETEGNPFKWN